MQQHRKGLLVDGDPSRRASLCASLRRLGFEPAQAEDGATGLLMAHTLRPEVVLLAAEAPVLNGFLFLEAVRSAEALPGTSIILLLSSSAPAELTRAWKAGADLCIPWPTGAPDLRAALRRILTGERCADPLPLSMAARA